MAQIRPAEVGDAAAIIGLVKSDFARLDPDLAETPIPHSDIEAFDRALLRPSETKRLVAVGSAGIEAYMKFGPWKWGDQVPFSTLPEVLRRPVYRTIGRLGWYQGVTGLFTLSTPDGQLKNNESVSQLVKASGVLKADELLIAAPKDEALEEWLRNVGAYRTDETAKLPVRISDSISTKPLPAALWRREKLAEK